MERIFDESLFSNWKTVHRSLSASESYKQTVLGVSHRNCSALGVSRRNYTVSGVSRTNCTLLGVLCKGLMPLSVAWSMANAARRRGYRRRKHLALREKFKQSQLIGGAETNIMNLGKRVDQSVSWR